MLKELREKAGLTQEELAQRAGCSYPLIFAYEQGKRSLADAKLKTVVNIAVALNCRITDLLTDEELVEKCRVIKL